MERLTNKINSFLYEDFIFSERYRVWRHISYWTFHVTVWAIFWMIMGSYTSFWRNVFNMSLWVPAFILFAYPLVYFAVPRLLLQGRVWQFILIILTWGVFGLYFNSAYRNFIYVPLLEAVSLKFTPQIGFQAHSYLCMTTSAASPMIIRFFKLWTIKQRDWLQIQQEKVTAELQLLKAQVHPHFLFNTLNNIYSFSLENSPKTADLILKLSSLLRYMLYNCKTEHVRLEKEVEVMSNYIDLEKERYGNKIKISWNVRGEMQNKFIVPLLLLPFLENAFKHGLSDQIESPWLEVEILITDNILLCKIANSKSENVRWNINGIGIDNVKKRLKLLYAGKHELSISQEGNYTVTLKLVLSENARNASCSYSPSLIKQTNKHETSLPAYR